MAALMYHGITSKYSQSPPEREAGAEIYDVKAEKFREQMESLKKSGKQAALTFDDGEMNNYEVALPILNEFGLKAHFFIIVKRIGRQGYMGFPELKTLVKEGMTVGSHGLSHEVLTNLTDDQIAEELKASKNCLERNLGVPVNSFSVPRGFCNEKIIQMALAAGYTDIFVSEDRKSLNPVCTPRAAVKANWSLKRFGQALDDRMPFSERIGGACKDMGKFVLKERGYNFVRKMLIYLNK